MLKDVLCLSKAAAPLQTSGKLPGESLACAEPVLMFVKRFVPNPIGFTLKNYEKNSL